MSIALGNREMTQGRGLTLVSLAKVLVKLQCRLPSVPGSWQVKVIFMLKGALDRVCLKVRPIGGTFIKWNLQRLVLR